jgi:hypothetical protein
MQAGFGNWTAALFLIIGVAFALDVSAAASFDIRIATTREYAELDHASRARLLEVVVEKYNAMGKTIAIDSDLSQRDAQYVDTAFRQCMGTLRPEPSELDDRLRAAPPWGHVMTILHQEISPNAEICLIESMSIVGR